MKPLNNSLFLYDSCVSAHFVEGRVGIREKLFRRVHLLHLSRIQDEDLGAVEDGLEAVRDGEDGALGEGRPDGREWSHDLFEQGRVIT